LKKTYRLAIGQECKMKLSKFGEKFTKDAGILQLMDDLGNALSIDKDILMLGGGNPGRIPQVEEILRKNILHLVKDKNAWHNLIGIYDPPRGNVETINSLVSFFNKKFGWKLKNENICLTNGTQTAFFMLFNMLAGEYQDNMIKKIQLPLSPEYIGYTDLGISGDIFISIKPKIEFLADNFFKYYIDFDHFRISNQAAAICVSRPTNPTGNVLTDNEIEKLSSMASEHKIPLIIDNAYGIPFPCIVYQDITPFWNENTIICMTLSKLGIPGARTGIIIAKEAIINALAKMNAIISLASGNFGGMLANNLIRSGKISTISKTIIRPFYEKKAKNAVKWLKDELKGFPYYIHKPEGAIFLWLWFKGLPISNMELYQRLKKRGVLVVSGHYFFPGLQEEWQHKNECIRITYSQDDKVVYQGIKIICEEVKKILRSPAIH
jgi:valine--pyruvate aminotransferase